MYIFQTLLFLFIANFAVASEQPPLDISVGKFCSNVGAVCARLSCKSQTESSTMLAQVMFSMKQSAHELSLMTDQIKPGDEILSSISKLSENLRNLSVAKYTDTKELDKVKYEVDQLRSILRHATEEMEKQIEDSKVKDNKSELEQLRDSINKLSEPNDIFASVLNPEARQKLQQNIRVLTENIEWKNRKNQPYVEQVEKAKIALAEISSRIDAIKGKISQNDEKAKELKTTLDGFNEEVRKIASNRLAFTVPIKASLVFLELAVAMKSNGFRDIMLQHNIYPDRNAELMTLLRLLVNEGGGSIDSQFFNHFEFYLPGTSSDRGREVVLVPVLIPGENRYRFLSPVKFSVFSNGGKLEEIAIDSSIWNENKVDILMRNMTIAFRFKDQLQSLRK